jgi:hypothetical protein
MIQKVLCAPRTTKQHAACAAAVTAYIDNADPT